MFIRYRFALITCSIIIILLVILNIFLLFRKTHNCNLPNYKMNIPDTISKEAQEVLKNMNFAAKNMVVPEPNDLEGWKKLQNIIEESSKTVNQDYIKKYNPQIKNLTVNNVSFIEIIPNNLQFHDDILIYIHGGGFTLGSAESSLYIAILMAHYTNRKIFTIDYTLAPEAKWQFILNEIIDVIEFLSSQYSKIAISGHSAGGSLACAAVLKLRNKNHKLPYAVLLFSPWSDVSENGDTYEVLKNEDPILDYNKFLKNSALAYAGDEDLKNQYISPVYAIYDNNNTFPPTLIQGGGTKEIFLSNFIRHYQVLDNANIPVKLDIYEGMFHVFPTLYPDLPESNVAYNKMNIFLNSYNK